MENYKSHLIMDAIRETDKKINCIPQNHSLGQTEFIDAFQSLSASLEKLVINMAGEAH